ncbi:MAG: hypothetical protein E7069_12080 [Bacteroidales bacterium]|nr:hypothetical protein [Bacteroidales bacterium]
MANKYDFNPVTGKIDMTGKATESALTAAQRATLEWAERERLGTLEKEALARFSVKTSVKGDVIYADEAKTTTMIVTAVVTFDSTRVDADETPDGWSKSSTGEYTRQLNSDSGTIDAAAFSYTIPSGDYEGIKVTKWSEKKEITTVYPAYYGLVAASDSSKVQEVVYGATRISAPINDSDTDTTRDIDNNAGETAWFWIVSRGTSKAVQFTTEITKCVATDASFTSPKNVDITLTGYNVYIAPNSVGKGQKMSSVMLSIKLK